MDIELIFNQNINQIRDEKLNNIRIMSSSIRLDSYSKLSEILKTSPQLENVFVPCEDGSEKAWNNFFRIFRNELGEFSIDPSKIILSGEVEKYNYDIFRDIKRLSLLPKSIKNISEIEKKFPKLESIEAVKDVEDKDIGDDCINLINFAKYTKCIELKKKVGEYSVVKSFIEENGLGEKLFLSEDGLCLINKDRLADVSKEPSNLKINLRDIEKIGIENLKKSKDPITLVAENVAELPIEKLSEYEALGIKVSGVIITSEKNNVEQNAPYDLNTYSVIREKLEELVEGISPNLTEKARFAEVYKRVCESIIYDTPAAYPKSKEEEKYSKAQTVNCRNMKNGLLEGKAVCAGYADILRNALSLVDIEAKYVSGPVIDKEIKKKNFNPEKLESGYVYKEDDEKVIIAENHAWNKVKLDGVWYNVDATWDARKIRAGKLPTYCLKSDEHIQKEDKKVEAVGPDCENNISEEEIKDLFGNGNKYIGNFKIPTLKDVMKKAKKVKQNTQNSVKRFKDRFSKIMNKTDTPQLESNNQYYEYEDEDNKKANPWAIENWGRDRNKFLSKSRDIAREPKETSFRDKEKDDFTK